MKKAKKWFAAAFVLCMVLHLSGCGTGGGDGGESKRMSLLLKRRRSAVFF